MEIELTDSNFKNEVLDETKLPVLVDFWAPWCGPCRMLTPAIAEIAAQYQGKLKVCKLNVDNSPQTASQYGIMSIPTLLIFKNGKIADTLVGSLPKTAIEEKLKPHV